MSAADLSSLSNAQCDGPDLDASSISSSPQKAFTSPTSNKSTDALKILSPLSPSSLLTSNSPPMSIKESPTLAAVGGGSGGSHWSYMGEHPLDGVAKVKMQLNIPESDSPGASKSNVVSSLKTPDPEGNLPIHLLLLTKTLKKSEIFEIASDIILKYPNSLTVQNKYGLTPIHLAAYRGIIRLLRLMLDIYPGAAGNSSVDGFYPLHMAAMGGSVEVCEYLYQFYNDAVHLKTKKGLLPENLAAKYKFLETESFLIKLKNKTPPPLPQLPGKQEVEKQLASFYSLNIHNNGYNENSSKLDEGLIYSDSSFSPTTKRNNLIWNQYKRKISGDKDKLNQLNSKLSNLASQSSNILLQSERELSSALQDNPNPNDTSKLCDEKKSSISDLFQKYRREPTVKTLMEQDPKPIFDINVRYDSAVGSTSGVKQVAEDFDDLTTTSSIIPDYLESFLTGFSNGSLSSGASTVIPSGSKVKKRSIGAISSTFRPIDSMESNTLSLQGNSIHDGLLSSENSTLSCVGQSVSVVLPSNDKKPGTQAIPHSKSPKELNCLTVTKLKVDSATNTTNNSPLTVPAEDSVNEIGTSRSGSRKDSDRDSTSDKIPIVALNSSSKPQLPVKKAVDRKVYVFNANEVAQSDLWRPTSSFLNENPKDEPEIEEKHDSKVTPYNISSLSSSSIDKIKFVKDSAHTDSLQVTADKIQFKNLEDFLKQNLPTAPAEEFKRSEKNASPRTNNINAMGKNKTPVPPKLTLLPTTVVNFSNIPNMMTFDKEGVLVVARHPGSPSSRCNSESGTSNHNINNNTNTNSNNNKSKSADVSASNCETTTFHVGVRMPDVYLDSHISAVNDSDDDDV